MRSNAMYENRATARNSSSTVTGLDDLISYLKRSSRVVQEYTDIIEHKYARPALEHFSEYFQTQPILTTWLAMTFTLFTIMSILPVLSFISISVFAVCGSMFFALTFAFAAVLLLVTMFAMVLLMVLGGLLLFSFILTTGGAMAYLAFRLIQHLQIQGRSGITEWALKTKQRFTSVNPIGNGDSDPSGVFLAHGAHGKVKNEDGSPHRGS